MLEHVEFIAGPALALGITNGEGTVADHAGEGDAVPGVEVVAADCLPGEITADPKATDAAVSSGYQFDASIISGLFADQSFSRVRNVADAFALNVSSGTPLVLTPNRVEAEQLP